MMQAGHVKLDGKEYMIEVAHYQRSLANPFAAKIGTGAGDYNDLDDWAAWLMEDWQQGVGKKDAEAGGVLYGEADTRFPKQMTLPPLLTLTGLSAAGIRQPGSVTDTLVTDSTSNRRYGYKFTAPVTETVTKVWVLVQPGVGFTVGIYSDSSGPNALVGSGGAVSSGETTPGYLWIGATVSAALTAATVYWVVVYPTTSTDALTLAASSGTLGDCMAYNGTTWANTLGSFTVASLTFFVVVGTAGLGSNGAIVDIVSFNGSIYAAAGTRVYKWGASTWAAVGAARAATITDLQVFNSVLYIGQGDGAVLNTMSTGEVYAVAAINGRLFTQWNGYLYRAIANDLYYTTDGATWTGPIEVGPDEILVRGMAARGQDNDLYVACDDGLYVLLGGDIVSGLTPWGSPETTNGRGTIHHGGDAYIPVANGLIRYTSGGQVLSVGLEQGEGLPALRQGKLLSTASQNNWLLACVAPTSAAGMATVWSWNRDGWNHVATLPAGMGGGPMYFDRSNSRLWIGTQTGLIGWVYVPDGNDNPLRDASATYAPRAWVETGWFAGGLKEVLKDVESIYIAGTLDDGQWATVYWQDDDSTGWETLGTYALNREEKQWPSSTRPETRRIRLGVLLATNNYSETPVIEAIRLKYVADVKDRWRWQLPVRVANRVEMLDGNFEERTAAEVRADLSDAIRSVAPVVYRDVDGAEYDVKITAAQESVSRYEIVGETVQFESMWYLSVLQVSADT